MKKFMYVILLALAVTIGTRADEMSTVSTLAVENQVLREQLSFEVGLKTHYQKMATYSEREAEISLAEASGFREYAGDLEYLLDVERTSSVARVNETNSIITEQNNIIDHYKGVVAGYENTLYEAIQANELDSIKYAKIEARAERSVTLQKLFLLGLVICFILYHLNKAYLNRTPKPKTTKTKTTTPLKIVPKDGGAKVKDTPKKTITTPSTKERSQLAKETNKATKARLALEARKAKELSPKKGDIAEAEPMEVVNKKLTKGILGGLIKSIWKTPIEKVETKTDETFEEVTKPTVVKDSTKGKGNGKSKNKKNK